MEKIQIFLDAHETIIDVIVAIGAVSALLVLVIKHALKHNRPLDEVISGKKDVYDKIRRLRRVLNASRVLVLYTENGGGIPSVSGPLFSTVEFESLSDSLNTVSDKWHHVKCDSNYISLMYEMINNGEIVLDVENGMDPGVLKQFYKRTRVKKAAVVPITQLESDPGSKFVRMFSPRRKFYYLSVTWVDEDVQIDSYTLTAIKSIAADLQKTLKV